MTTNLCDVSKDDVTTRIAREELLRRAGLLDSDEQPSDERIAAQWEELCDEYTEPEKDLEKLVAQMKALPEGYITTEES